MQKNIDMVYQFPNSVKEFLSVFKRLCKKHHLTYLGPGQDVTVVDSNEPDYFVEGSLEDLEALAEDLDYALHPDYLISAEEFARDEILYEALDTTDTITYQLSNEIKNLLPEFGRLCEEYSIEFLGKEGEDGDFYIRGTQVEIENLLDFLDYEFVQESVVSSDSVSTLKEDIEQDEIEIEEPQNTSSLFTDKESEQYAKELTQLFFDLGGFYDIWADKNVINALIEWGDWKHDHLEFKNTVLQFFDTENIEINIGSQKIEEDDTGLYSCRYTIIKQ